MAMKTLFASMSILLLTFTSIASASITSYEDKSTIPVSGLLPDDLFIADYSAISHEYYTLEVKGSFIGGYEAEVFVYHYIDDQWVQDYSIEGKKGYSIRLNPELDYQVLFLSPEGGTKVMYIESGIYGNHLLQCDVDFTISSNAYLRLYQNDSGKYLLDSCSDCDIAFNTHPVEAIKLDLLCHDQ